MIKRKKGFFSISAVAEMFSVHQQTIRLYEKEGLISPKRSEGNTRLFSEEDVNRLEEIIYLTHELGINLAGVEMILKLQKQIRKLQKEINFVFDSAHAELSKESETAKNAAKVSASRLVKLKQSSMRPAVAQSNPEQSRKSENNIKQSDYLDQWKIDYEE